MQPFSFFFHKNKHPLLIGAALLTLTGLASRVIGFFYRIFLSHTIGAKGLGIYQLIFPVFSLGVAFCSAGIQTAISKFTAETIHKKKGRQAWLYSGMCLSTLLSLFCSMVVYCFAGPISARFLGEPRCCGLLQILAFSFPPAAIHACVNGYYYGLQKTMIPSLSQLLEQVCRCLCVYLVYRVCLTNGYPVRPSIAVYGIVCGEFAGAIFSLSVVRFQKFTGSFSKILWKLIGFSLPLTANRVSVNLAGSIEALLIPFCLKLYGYANEDALSIFGVLTGMAMPMILFPSVLTNSVSVMLLPSISQARARRDQALIRRTIHKTIQACLSLGFGSSLFFLLGHRLIGNYVFANALAGQYIKTLSFICPFLFLSTTLSSIIHGLDHPAVTLVLNLSGCLIRILSIRFLVPLYGIRGYLWGMLASQVMIALCGIILLNRFLSHGPEPASPA